MTEHRGAAAEEVTACSPETSLNERRRPPRLAIFLHWQNNHGMPACEPLGHTSSEPEAFRVTTALGLVDCPDCVLWLERAVRKMLGRKKT